MRAPDAIGQGSRKAARQLSSHHQSQSPAERKDTLRTGRAFRFPLFLICHPEQLLDIFPSFSSSHNPLFPHIHLYENHFRGDMYETGNQAAKYTQRPAGRCCFYRRFVCFNMILLCGTNDSLIYQSAKGSNISPSSDAPQY